MAPRCGSARTKSFIYFVVPILFVSAVVFINLGQWHVSTNSLVQQLSFTAAAAAQNEGGGCKDNPSFSSSPDHDTIDDYCSIYDFVFIAGTGRSGSTTLMAFLNSIPGVHLSGENDGMTERVLELYDSFKALSTTRKKAIAWANAFEMTKIKQDMAEIMVHMINPPAGSEITGFKEIRLVEERHFDFIRLLFPCAKFILNIREDVASQSASSFLAKADKVTHNVSDTLAATNGLFESLARRHPDYMHLIKLEEFSTEKLDEILGFIGGLSHCRTLQVPHVNGQGGMTKTKDFVEPSVDIVECSGDGGAGGKRVSKKAVAAAATPSAGDRRIEERKEAPTTTARKNTPNLPSLPPPAATSSPAQEEAQTSFGYPCASSDIDDAADDPWTAIASRSAEAKDPNIAICALIRNEAPVLDEWIAFHWLQGVRKFVLYDDSSQDRTLQILDKYVQRNIVELRAVDRSIEVQAPDDTNRDVHPEIQLAHLNQCLQEMWERRDADGQEQGTPLDWVLLSDADEFAYAKDSNMSLAQALNIRENKGTQCVYISRTDFGSSGHVYRPDSGLMIENYVRSAGHHREISAEKIIVDLRPYNKNGRITEVYSPHRVYRETKKNACIQDAGKHLQMNQYLRSLEDYNVKLDTFFLPGDKKLKQKPLQEFFLRDRNEVVDDSAPRRFACDVKKLLAYWGGEDKETKKRKRTRERKGKEE